LEGKDRRTEGKGVSRTEEVGGAQKGGDKEQKGKELAGERRWEGHKRERTGNRRGRS